MADPRVAKQPSAGDDDPYALRATARIAMQPLLTWLESTGIATSVASSATLTASLSAVHVIGFTLVTGGALVANLRSLGALFRERNAVDVAGPANRAILLGLAISVSTGLLLFSARATEASANGTFRLKMFLLVAAVLFHFVLQPRAAARGDGLQRTRAASAIGLTLWLALAVTACAFILLE
jgi:hypothetical protein